ncbi:MAG: M12 family metallo-peptidase [Planctomycetota bacterium]
MPRPFAAFLRLAAPFAACLALLPAQSAGQPALLPPAAAQAFGVQAGTLQSLTLPANPVGLVGVPMVLAGAPVLLEVAPFDVRSQGFQLWVRAGDQLTEVTPPPAVTTWRGAIAGEVGSAVAATIDNGSLTAYVRRGSGDVWVVQPLRAVVPGAAATAHAVFRGADTLPHPGFCGVTQGAAPAPAGGGEDIVYACELALEADFPLFQANLSSIANTQNDVLGVVNAVDLIYRNDVQIDLTVSQLVVNSTPDPYTSSVAGTLLSQFQQRWTTTYAAVPRDVAHLMTGRNVGQASGGTIGLAYVGAVCNPSFGYGLSQTRFSANFGLRVAVTAHELGHNFNATHCDGQAGCAIMCSSAGGCTGIVNTFSAGERAQITAFRSSAPCLTAQPSTPQLTSVTPNTFLTVNPPIVTINGTGLFGVNLVTIGGTAITAGITVVSDTQVRLVPPVGLSLGPQLLSVANSAGTSNSQLVVVNPANPCLVFVPSATFGGANLAWRMGGWAGDPALLGVGFVNTTSPFLGQQLMDGFLTIWSGVLDNRGLANLAIVLPPGLLTGFTFYSQLLDIDPVTGGLRSASTLPSTWIVF